MKILPHIILSVLLCWSAFAEYSIPSTNRINWHPAGLDVVGGIPTTFTSTNTLSSSGLTTTVINNAITAAASNTVVQLPAGSYTMSGIINMKSGVVLRGAKAVGTYGTSWLPAAAASATTLDFTSSGDIRFNGGQGSSDWTPGAQSGYTITSGYTQGSTSVVVSGGSFAVNDYICIYQDDNAAWIDPSGGHGTSTVGGSALSYLGEDSSPPHVFAQYKKVTNVSGSTLIIDPPIYLVTPDATGAKVRKQNMGVRMAGLEDIRLKGPPGSDRWLIFMRFTALCWIKGCETYKADNNGSGSPHIWCQFSYANEVRGCYLNDGTSHDSGRNYGVEFYNWNSRHLVINNIIRETRHSVAFEGGGNGCVVAYNYTDDNWESVNGAGTTIDNTQLSEDLMPNHGSHPFMNLFEGNASICAWGDYTQGSSGHITLFRNRLNMIRSNHPLGGTPGTYYAIEVERKNYYYYLVGNILGNPSFSSGTVLMNSSSEPTRPVMYRYGRIANGGIYSDPQSFNTSVRHGNYDFITDGIAEWASADHAIPVSLYYTNGAKPSWFGDKPWPPYDNANVSWAAIDRTNIPAGQVYVFGTNGAAATDSENPVVAITGPTSSPTYDNAASLFVNLSGTASDNVGLSAVTWANDLGGNGSASGTTTWTATAVPLLVGLNTITVTARDTSNNTSTDSIAVTVTNGPTPMIRVLYATNYFGEIFVSNTTNKVYTVTNAGTSTLNGTALANAPWSISGNANYSLATGFSTNITVVFTPGAVLGYYSNTISFTGGGATNPPVTARAVPIASNYSNMTAINFLIEQPYSANGAGNYISQPVETSGAPELGGRASVGFTLLSTSDLTISMMVNGQTTGSDSVYVEIDEEPTDPTDIFDFIPLTSTNFVSRTLNKRGTGTPTAPQYTNYVFSNVVAGTHLLILRGREADAQIQSVSINAVAQGTIDTTKPTITITSPTSAATYTSATTNITVSGTAADNTAVSQVIYETDRGASGVATGTTSWSFNFNLQIGTNVLTVTALDALSNQTNDVLTIFLGPTNTFPTVIQPPYGIRVLQ